MNRICFSKRHVLTRTINTSIALSKHWVVSATCFISSQNDVSMIYNDGPNSVRCNISRAVAQLTIILEIKADALGSNSIRMLYHSTDIDATFVKCQKTIKFNAFKCNSIHSKTSSTSALSSLSPILEQQQNLEASSRYVCESCIHVCHNNHKDRLYAKFGGGSFSTAFGGSRSILFGDFPRVIRNTIAGATRCCCNKITTCQLHDGWNSISVFFVCHIVLHIALVFLFDFSINFDDLFYLSIISIIWFSDKL